LKVRTPLCEPSARGNLNVVEWLLSKNADPDISDNDDMSSLKKAGLIKLIAASSEVEHLA